MRAILLLSFAALACAAAYGESAASNSYWPLTVGNRWLFVDPETRSPTVMTVQQPPLQFGCVPLTSTPDSSPIELDIVKLHPGNYWQGGTSFNLRFFLAIPAPPSLPFGVHGDVLSVGWIAEDYSTGAPGTIGPGGVTNIITLGALPSYRLLQAQGRPGQYSTMGAYVDVSPADRYHCAADATHSITRRWSSEWAPTTVTVPAFSGSVVDAYYLEDSGTYGGVDNKEHWYFAQGIGPVRLAALDPVTNKVAKALDLIAFEPGDGRPVSSQVTLRDVLLAYAGSTASRSYAEWAMLFSKATGLRSPNASEVCFAANPVDSAMTADQFLSQIERAGSSECDQLRYPRFPNGQAAAEGIAAMQSAGDQSRMRNFDQWNFAFSAVTGAAGHPPELRCMATVKTIEIPGVFNSIDVVPLRWAAMTARQWLLFHNSTVFGCVDGSPAS